jgi:hypothetical protein
MDHELIKDDFSRRAYIIYEPSASVLSRLELPRCGGQPTFMRREVGIKDDGCLYPMVANNTTDIDLPLHLLQGTAPTRAFLSCDRGPTSRQRLEYLIAMVTPIRWLLLLLSMMLSSQGLPVSSALRAATSSRCSPSRQTTNFSSPCSRKLLK